MGNALLKKRKIKRAKEKANNALNISQKIDAKEEVGMSKRLHGMIYREKEKWDEAIKMFNESIDVLEKCGNERKLSKVYYEFSILLKKKEDDEIARVNLEKAYDIFDKMNMETWKKKADEALEEYLMLNRFHL